MSVCHLCVRACMRACLPFWPAGRLDYRSHTISVQAFGLGEIHHIENDSLKIKREQLNEKEKMTENTQHIENCFLPDEV